MHPDGHNRISVQESLYKNNQEESWTHARYCLWDCTFHFQLPCCLRKLPSTRKWPSWPRAGKATINFASDLCWSFRIGSKSIARRESLVRVHNQIISLFIINLTFKHSLTHPTNVSYFKFSLYTFPAKICLRLSSRGHIKASIFQGRSSNIFNINFSGCFTQRRF